MAQHTLHFLDQDEHNFLSIKAGLKTVETRAGSPEYLKIKPGDKLLFTCKDQTLEKIVKEVRRYASSKAAINSVGLKNVAPDAPSVAVAVKRYRQYPGYDYRIKKYGILAFFLC